MHAPRCLTSLSASGWKYRSWWPFRLQRRGPVWTNLTRRGRAVVRGSPMKFQAVFVDDLVPKSHLFASSGLLQVLQCLRI